MNDQKVHLVEKHFQEWLLDNQYIFNFYEEREFFYMVDRVSKERAFLFCNEVWAMKTDKKDMENIVDEIQSIQHIGKGVSVNYKQIEEYLKDRVTEWSIGSKGDIGIPIPTFRYKKNILESEKDNKFFVNDKLITHLRKLFYENGPEIWYHWDIESLLPIEYKYLSDQLEKDFQVFDFWFESSTCWHAILEKKIHQKKGMLLKESETYVEGEIYDNDDLKIEFNKNVKNINPLKNNSFNQGNYPCDLQIEGIDSADGSLQAQILSQAIVKGYPGFNIQKKHGIFVDGDGKRISKNNHIVKVDDLINGTFKVNDEQQYGMGVDVLRLLCASYDLVEENNSEFNVSDLGLNVKQSEINLIRKIYWSLFRLISSHLNCDLDYKNDDINNFNEGDVKNILYEKFFGGNSNVLLKLQNELSEQNDITISRLNCPIDWTFFWDSPFYTVSV